MWPYVNASTPPNDRKLASLVSLEHGCHFCLVSIHILPGIEKALLLFYYGWRGGLVLFARAKLTCPKAGCSDSCGLRLPAVPGGW